MIGMDHLYQNVKSFTTQATLVTFLFTTLSVWYCNYLWSRRKLYWYSMKVHGPMSFPIIGSAYVFFFTSVTDIVSTVIKLQEMWPGICKIWVGPKLVYFVSEPQDIAKITNSPDAIEKEDFYSLFNEFLGEGILTAPGRVWKPHRKIVSPSFNKRILDSFVTIFAKKSRILVEKINEVILRDNMDWYSLASKCTLDIVCETTMGVNVNLQTNSTEDLGTSIERILQIVNYRIFRVWYQLNIVWNLSALKQEFEEHVNKFRKITSAVIRQKMLKYQKEKLLLEESVYAEIEDDQNQKNLALLDTLVENSSLTEKELTAEVFTVIGAGSETSASALCSLFTFLGMFPDIQQLVYEEVMEILGPDRNVESTDLPMMKYTERVIKETLRINPIGALLGRKLSGDINLGHVTLPEGASIVFNTVFIHRNPKYWKNPLKFDPNRFLPEEVAKRHPCTYIPFSSGPRNCIGWKYAILSLKTMVATVIREYKIFSTYKSIEDIQMELQTTLRFKEGFKISFERR